MGLRADEPFQIPASRYCKKGRICHESFWQRQTGCHGKRSIKPCRGADEYQPDQRTDAQKRNCILWILAIIGAVAAVAGIAYAVYRFFTPDYLEDFEDDFDDDFDDDFFEDEESVKKAEEKKEEKEEDQEA